MTKLKISFPMTGRYSDPIKLDQEMDIVDLATYYKENLITEEGSSVENSLRIISKNIQLEDRKGNTFDLNKIWYKPWQFDQLMFVAAHIIEINQYKKNYCHLLCEYMDSGNVYKGCFVVQEERFSEAYENNEYNCIVGTCIRKRYKASMNYKYNKYAHSSTATIGEEKKVTKMLNFYIF